MKNYSILLISYSSDIRYVYLTQTFLYIMYKIVTLN